MFAHHETHPGFFTRSTSVFMFAIVAATAGGTRPAHASCRSPPSASSSAAVTSGAVPAPIGESRT